MMEDSKIKEVRKKLAAYVDSCSEAKTIAEKMGFTKVVAKIDKDINSAREAMQVTIAKSRFEDARLVESTDPKKAMEIAKEAIEILQEPPEGVSEKEELIKQIQNLMMQHGHGRAGQPEGTGGEKHYEGGSHDKVEEDIKKRLEAAEIHAKNGNVDEALKICNDAIKVAIETGHQDLEELARKKEQEIEWKEKFGDLDNEFDKFLNENILISESKMDDALKLMAEDGTTHAELDKRGEKLVEEINRFKEKISGFVDTALDQEKKEQLKRRLIDKVSEITSKLVDLVTETSASIRNKIFVHTELPDVDNVEERTAYFRMKHEKVVKELGRFVEGL